MTVTCTSYDGEKCYAIDKGYIKFHFKLYSDYSVYLLGIEVLPENKYKILRFPNNVKINHKIYKIINGFEWFFMNDLNHLFYMPWVEQNMNYILFNNILIENKKSLWKNKWKIL